MVKKVRALGVKEWKLKSAFLQIRPGDVLWIQQPQQYSPKILQECQKLKVVFISQELFPEEVRTLMSTFTIPSSCWIMENDCFALLDWALAKESKPNRYSLKN